MAAADESTNVIAINKDPEAPICQVSDYYLLEPIPNSSSPNRSLEKDFKKFKETTFGKPSDKVYIFFLRVPSQLLFFVC